jgi:hypothetical protein
MAIILLVIKYEYPKTYPYLLGGDAKMKGNKVRWRTLTPNDTTDNVKKRKKMKVKSLIIIVMSALSLIILCISLKYTYSIHARIFKDNTEDSKSARNGVLTHWEGRDIVFINGEIYEYNLYTATNERLDDAVTEILDYFWKNEAPLFDAVYSVNRSDFIENNTALSDGVKRMMTHKNANISTTKYFHMVGGRCILTFIINYTKDFNTYSILNTWDEVSPWWGSEWDSEDEDYQAGGLEYQET